MPSSSDWARTIGTTLVTHLKEEEQTTFRKFKVFAALEANGKVRGKLKSTEKFGTTNGNAIWDMGNQPLNGYSAAVTNAVPSNLTKGTGTNLSAIIFGNFADLMIGMWGSLDLLVDPYTGSTAGTVRVVALQDVDVALRNVESFATMVDAITV